MNPFLKFASEEEAHISLAAEEIGKIGDFVVTNSMIYGIIMSEDSSSQVLSLKLDQVDEVIDS